MLNVLYQCTRLFYEDRINRLFNCQQIIPPAGLFVKVVAARQLGSPGRPDST